jgi:pentatricopeptide repeat protein
MKTDARGLALSTDSEEAAQALDSVVDSYLNYRTDVTKHVGRMLKADPGFALGHVVKGYFMLLMGNRAYLPAAAEALAQAEAGAAAATTREKLHVEALRCWLSGKLDGALAAWEAVLALAPTDILTMRLAHFLYFWLGEAARMRDSAARARAGWSDDLPGYGLVLGMHAFGLEEGGDAYAEAERLGRRAVELHPGDLWATHAVAHVLEMQGRHAEGVRWLEGLAPSWTGVNNFAHHLWWHLALYRIEQGEADEALRLYDRDIRNLASPLLANHADFYLDMQNAAALLWRLELMGLDVGDRWKELAEKSEARIGDHVLLFTVPHFMMALAASGRWPAAERVLTELREFAAEDSGTLAPIVAAVCLPACEAVLAYRRGEFDRAVERLAPARKQLWRIGGSHAQRDVFWQTLIDACLRGGRTEDARGFLQEALTGPSASPPRRFYVEAERRGRAAAP